MKNIKIKSAFQPKKILSKFEPIEIKTDLSSLSDEDLTFIKSLINCAKVLNDIFLLQKHPDNLKIKKEINALRKKDLQRCFQIMSGPFNIFEENKSYIVGMKSHDKAGFYDSSITFEEWSDYLKKYPDKQIDFISPYTIIQKKNKELHALPYSEYYTSYLKKAASYLNKALPYIKNSTLYNYISAQAEAFINNSFDDASIKWLQIKDNKILPLLGPFESYDDKFLGYKASFTSFIGLKNNQFQNKTDFILKNLNTLQDRLPIPKHYTKLNKIQLSYIEIIDLIYFSGDARSPIPTTAFNLPNSQQIRSEYGSKKVILHNILKEKFHSIMEPISRIILKENDQEKIEFHAYFNYILFHEISHELGIGFIDTKDGDKKSPSYFLKDLYPVIEEAKSDVMGVYSLVYLIKQGIITDSTLSNICLIYLTNLIRFIRFGKENAHGLASLIQFNFLINEQVFILESEQNYIMVDYHKIEKAVEKLLVILLTLEGEGDYAKSAQLIENYSSTLGYLPKYFSLIKKVPLDIFPWFPIADEKK